MNCLRVALLIVACLPVFGVASETYTPEKSEQIRDGVLFEKNVRVPMSDGSYLMANVFRPIAEGTYPVLLSMSVYGKDLFIGDFEPYKKGWQGMLESIPDLCAKSSCKYATWETVDPEIWVPYGYVVVRADSRGSGKSPGHLDPFQKRETQDLEELIGWASKQAWSNGKLGLSGISYYAMNQWVVASRAPEGLTAIVPWEGASDFYRDVARHGGILSNVFSESWFVRQSLPIQHGNGASPYTDLDDGTPIGGRDSLTDAELAKNRSLLMPNLLKNRLDGRFYRERSADFSAITVPLLSSANWGGFGLHARGNFAGFTESASKQKWLEVHGGNHRDAFYARKGHDLQKAFYDHFLRGEDNGWDQRPPVLLEVRHADGRIVERQENEWPLARTQWNKHYLMPEGRRLLSSAPSFSSQGVYAAFSDGVSFTSLPFREQTELTGPGVLRVFVSSSTSDLDLFATLIAKTPDGKVVSFPGASEDATPLSQGWLRASHRKLDPERSKPYQPWHTHDKIQPLKPGEIYELQVELWPMNVVLPAGSTVTLNLRGRDYSTTPEGGIETGSGPFLHTDPRDRPVSIFGGQNSIIGGGDFPSYLLLPVIPSK